MNQKSNSVGRILVTIRWTNQINCTVTITADRENWSRLEDALPVCRHSTLKTCLMIKTQDPELQTRRDPSNLGRLAANLPSPRVCPFPLVILRRMAHPWCVGIGFFLFFYFPSSSHGFYSESRQNGLAKRWRRILHVNRDGVLVRIFSLPPQLSRKVMPI